MTEALASLGFKRSIVLLKVLSNGALSAIDADTALYFIHPQRLKVIGGRKAGVPQLREWGNHADVGLFGQVFAAVIPNTGKALLYAVKTKKLLHRLGRHQGEVASVAIDPKTRYLLTGGEDGKLFAWDIKSGAPAFTLPMHTDHVTAIAFSDDASYVATGSYDKLIHFMPFEATKRPRKLYGHRSVVVKLLFLDAKRLLSAGREGEVLLWDLQRGKIAKRFQKCADEITSLSLCSQQRYLFVGTKRGGVHLYDLQGDGKFEENYLQMKSTVTALAYIAQGDLLAVGTLQGSVDIFGVMGDEAALSGLVDTRRYAEFYGAVGSNMMLRSCAAYEEAEEQWRAAFDEAKRHYGNGDILKATEALKEFSDVECKKPFIRELLRDSDALLLFKGHVDAKRYALAYAAAEDCPKLKETVPYMKMEDEWNEVMRHCRRLAGQKKGEEAVHAILAPYRGISVKTAAIRQLLDEGRYHLFFRDLIGKQEWKRVFELLKQQPFLKETREYFRLVNFADKLFIEASQAYERGELSRTRQLCEILEHFPDFRDDAREMLDDIHRRGRR